MNLLTISDVAQALNISIQSVYAAIQRGDLAVIATGARKGYRIHPDDLTEYIDARRHGRRLAPWPEKTNPKPQRRQQRDWF